MFKDCLVSQDRTTRPSPEKLIGIGLSVLFHILIVYAFIHAKFTVRIMPLRKEEVRSVMIVPPLKASIPRIVGGRAAPEVPEGLTEEEPGLESGVEGGGGPPATPPTPAAPPSTEPPAPASTPGTDAPPGSTAVPSLSSRFRESLASSRRTSGDPSLSITLAPPGTPPGPPGGSAGPVTGPTPDFTKYISGPLEGLSGAYGPGTGRGRGTGRGQRVGISIPLKDYDLAPWAVQVVDRLQRFWELPSVAGIPGEAAVKFIVVIKKNGELDSIEIMDRTSAEALDRAAIQALRASLPFPALPEDFPGDLLEIHFEFVYTLQ